MIEEKTESKRVIIIIGTLNSLGGAEKQAFFLAEGLLNKGMNVTLLSFGGGKLENLLKEKKISYKVFSFNFLATFRKKIIPLVKLTLLLRRMHPDVIIPYVTINSKYVGLIWKYTGAGFACWNQRDEGREIFGTRLERYSIKNVPVVISNSIAGKNVLVSKLGVKADRVRIINNGIEIPDKILSDNWRQKLNVADNTLIITMLASIYKYKDHLTLLQAWPKVRKELHASGKEAILVFAGKDKGLTDTLKIRAFDLRIAESVYFIGQVNNVSALIEDSDLIVHSSNTEGCPNAVLEAMAHSKAVVATNISGIRQALGDKYESDCMNKPGDSEDLAKKIVGLINNIELKQAIGSYNFERIQKEFSMDKMINSYWDAFQPFINK